MSQFEDTEIVSKYIYGHNECLQDQYQRDSFEVETMIAVISQAQDLVSLLKYQRDPIHYIFIIDDPLFLEYCYLEQFKFFVLGYTQKKQYLAQDFEQEINDIFSIYVSFELSEGEEFISLVSSQSFRQIQNEDQFYQIFQQEALQQKYMQAHSKMQGDQKEDNPSSKLLEVYNLVFKECTDLCYNNSIVFISSMLNTTPYIQIEKQLFGLLPNDHYMNYNFKLHTISLRKNSFELLQKLSSSTLGYYFYANDFLRQILLYSLDQILICHTRPYIKNYKIELLFDDQINLIKQVSPCSKWVANDKSGKNQSYKIQQKYFCAKEEKISLVSLTFNPTNNIAPGVYKIGSVTHSFQLPQQRKRISFTSDVVVTLSNESTYQYNPQCVIFYEQCKFIQFGYKILQSLLQFDWAQVDQLLPLLRQVFSIYISDSAKYQNLVKSSKYLLERITVFKSSFSPQTKNHLFNFQRETISKEECYNQIYKMIEYLHNINHFLINLG